MQRIVWGMLWVLCLGGHVVFADSQTHDFHRTQLQSAAISVDTITLNNVLLAEKKRLFGKRFLRVKLTVSNAGPVDKDVAVFLAGYNQDWQQVIFVAGLKPPRDAVPKNGSVQLERSYYIRKGELNKVEHVTIRLIVHHPQNIGEIPLCQFRPAQIERAERYCVVIGSKDALF